MSDDGNAAVFVGTFLQNGDAVALCGDCLPQFAVAVAANTTGVPVDALAAAVAKLEAEHADMQPSDPAEVAAPPHMAEHGAPTDEPPAPAPADPDPTVDNGPSASSKRVGRTPNGSGAPVTGTAGDADESPPPTTVPPTTVST